MPINAVNEESLFEDRDWKNESSTSDFCFQALRQKYRCLISSYRRTKGSGYTCSWFVWFVVEKFPFPLRAPRLPSVLSRVNPISSIPNSAFRIFFPSVCAASSARSVRNPLPKFFVRAGSCGSWLKIFYSEFRFPHSAFIPC